MECAVLDWQGLSFAGFTDGTHIQLTVADWPRFGGGVERKVEYPEPGNLPESVATPEYSDYTYYTEVEEEEVSPGERASPCRRSRSRTPDVEVEASSPSPLAVRATQLRSRPPRHPAQNRTSTIRASPTRSPNWKLGHHAVNLPCDRWLPRLLHRKPIGQRCVGRPHQKWDDMLRRFCRYKRFGGWELAARDGCSWETLMPEFMNFCTGSWAGFGHTDFTHSKDRGSTHFISKPRVSDTCAWHTGALLAPCETKGSRQDFPLLQVGKQGLVKVSTPDRSGCKFVHLGPRGILWASLALRLFSNPGPKGWTRKYALLPHISGRQSFQKTLTGDKSGCLKFLGGRFAPTQSCLRSCSQRRDK